MPFLKDYRHPKQVNLRVIASLKSKYFYLETPLEDMPESLLPWLIEALQQVQQDFLDYEAEQIDNKAVFKPFDNGGKV